MQVQEKFETNTIPKSPKLTRLVTVDILSLVHHFHLN